jgi:hypothetical protein
VIHVSISKPPTVHPERYRSEHKSFGSAALKILNADIILIQVLMLILPVIYFNKLMFLYLQL